jgi:hypothetical protein
MRLKYGIIGGILIALVILGVWLVIRYFFIPSSSLQSPVEINPNSEKFRQEIKDAAVGDSDLDGLSDEEEKRLSTDLNNPDSDGDGLLDGDEVHQYHSDPLKADTDDDGISDGRAVRTRKDPKGGFLPPPLQPTST